MTQWHPPLLWRRLAVASLLLGGLGCQESAPHPTEFRYHLSEAPFDLDPARSDDFYSLGVVDRLFDGLVRIDRIHGRPEPEIATSWTLSDDGRVYDFRLRADARFHNGRQVLAVDFLNSWERLLDPAGISPSAWLLERIEGAGAFSRGEASSISGLEVLGANRLRIRLDSAFAPFLFHLADPATSVVPLEVVRQRPDRFGREPVGSGPFRLIEWIPEKHLILERFEDHGWNLPTVRRLIYEIVPNAAEALEMFRQGRLDLLTEVPASTFATSDPNDSAELRSFPSPRWSGFCFRTDWPPFDDRRVRQAISLAIDRAALLEDLSSEDFLLATGLIPPGVPGHDSERTPSSRDLDRARALLAEAGYPEGRGFPPINFVSHASDSQHEIARSLTDGLTDLGIEASHQFLGISSMIRAGRDGQLPLFSISGGAVYPDPEPYLRPHFRSGEVSNLTAYHVPEVDRLLDEARIERDAERRLELYQAVEARVLADKPCVPLLQPSEVSLLRLGWRGLPFGLGKTSLEVERVRWVSDSR